MKDPVIKWIFGILTVLVCAGVLGAVAQNSLISRLQTEVENLKRTSTKSEAETNREIAAKIEQEKTDDNQWQSFRREVNSIKESLQHHDRMLYTFHGKEFLQTERTKP